MARTDLAVWMNGVHVATWTRTPAGKQILRYDPGWEESRLRRSLAMSLPVLPGCPDLTGPVVASYFNSLLPVSEALREQMRARCGARTTETRELLSFYGTDCCGAVNLRPQGVTPVLRSPDEARTLAAPEIAQLLAEVAGEAPPGSSMLGQIRVALPGSHPKFALLKVGHEWKLPLLDTPTTHIWKAGKAGKAGGASLKTDAKAGGEAFELENEWLCLAIVRALGLPAVSAELLQFRQQQALVMERFDRRCTETLQHTICLPTESLQHAIGKDALKNDRFARPGLKAAMRLMAGGSRADEDRLDLLLADVATWLLAAGHCAVSHFSIFLEKNSGFRLTPLCGVVSGWTRPEAIGDHAALDWREIARQCGVAEGRGAIEAMIRELPQALAQVEATLPRNFPRAVFDVVRAGMLARAATVVSDFQARPAGNKAECGLPVLDEFHDRKTPGYRDPRRGDEHLRRLP